MLFRKLKFSNTPHPEVKDSEEWYLIIRTVDELMQLLEIDSKRIVEDFISFPANYGKNHLSIEQNSLESLLSAKAHSLKEGETLDPVKYICDLLDRKGKAMFSIINSGKQLLVQKTGSYCDYETFINIWNNPIIISEINKLNCFFPENIPQNIDLLFLENADKVSDIFETEIMDITQNINHYKLTNLKYQDPEIVRNCVLDAKIIAIETQLADKNQVQGFLNMLYPMHKKTIYLKTNYIHDLANYDLFSNCIYKHDIKILN